MSHPRAAALSSVVIVASLASLSGAAAEPRDAGHAAPTPVVAELGDVSSLDDVGLHRRAVELLELGRHRDGSTWADARLRDEPPVAVHRPGEARPAYAEFSVEGPDGDARGFLMLATGEHDAPLVHAAMEGESPTRRLRAMAGGVEPARFLRLGHTYVAEDATHELVANVGELPAKMVAYDPGWLDLSDRERAGRSRGDASMPSPVGGDLRFEAWASWAAIRAEYGANRAPLHERDRRAAAPAWAFERWLAGNGESLQAGEFRELPLLARGDARVQVRGAGAPFVRTQLGERTLEGDTALTVFVEAVPPGVHPVDIDVTYADGSAETLRLNVTDRIPSRVLGLNAPAATGGTVTERIAPLAAPGVACKKVVLRASGHGYLRMDGSHLVADGRDPGQGARLRIDHMGGGRVTLRAPDGKYVEAHDGGGGDVTATAIGPVANAVFRMFENTSTRDGQIGFQTADRQHFVISLADAAIRATHARSEWSRFELAACEPTRTAAYWAGATFEEAWTNTRKFRQLRKRESPSTSQCASGCGATAWAMLFGFHDYQASLGVPKWRNLWGLYRTNGSRDGADAVPPEWMPRDGAEAGIKNMVWEISQKMNDWTLAGCAPNGQKWTAPVIMGRAHQYLDGRVTGVTLGSDYDGAMIFTNEGKTKVKDLLRRLRQPVVIGIRDPEHYPLAIGWETSRYRLWDRNRHAWTNREQRAHFVVHLGHNEPDSELVPYDSWFQGWLRVPETAVGSPAAAAQSPVTKEKASAPMPAPQPKPNVKLPTKKGPAPAPSPKW